MRKRLLWIGLLLVLIGAVRVRSLVMRPVLLPPMQPTLGPSYQAVSPYVAIVHVFDDSMSQVSHIEITPDGQYMLVGTLPGTVWIYHKVDGMFRRQNDPFFVVKTSQPGWPPQEAGLTGIALGADFEKSADVFLLYSFAKEKRSFRNRVLRVTFTKRGKKVVGRNPVEIFEANTPGTGSHQIQKGVGVMVAGKPHLLFNLGEGFVAERALNPKEEAGKVMLIQRDGSTPVGTRPFPESPKVQAIGVRNPPAIARNPVNGKITIGDTGPSNFDRFLYGALFDESGQNDQKISFNWNGTEESLKLAAPDLYDSANADMVLYRWAPTEMVVNIAFYENEKLPKLPESQQYVLIALFGKTGEPGNEPGKKIMLGILTHGRNTTLALTPLIVRSPDVEGKLGHPLGLAVDPTTKEMYFGDILEGRIYRVVVQ